MKTRLILPHWSFHHEDKTEQCTTKYFVLMPGIWYTFNKWICFSLYIHFSTYLFHCIYQNIFLHILTKISFNCFVCFPSFLCNFLGLFFLSFPMSAPKISVYYHMTHLCVSLFTKWSQASMIWFIWISFKNILLINFGL